MIIEEFKRKAYELRKLGKSYNTISKKLGIPKSTLSYWFQYTTWSRDVRIKNVERLKAESTERILKYTEERKKRLNIIYENAKIEALNELPKYKTDPIFVAALMLYLGEGDKSINGHSLRICNVDPAVLKIFIKFINKFCKINPDKIKFWLLCYPNLDVKFCEKWWSQQLNIPVNLFYKTQIIEGRHKKKKLPYGVGNITIGGKVLKTKVLHWIDLMCKELMRV